MTPTELLALVRLECAEDSQNFWTDNEIYSYMSNGERILAARLGLGQSGAIESTWTSDSTANTREYTMPSNLQTITRITYDAKKLKRIDFTDQDWIEGDTTSSGEPDYYYQYGSVIGLVSTPSSDSTQIKMWYNALPTVLTSTSTTFSVPLGLEHYLADYCLYRMFLKDQELSTEATTHLKLWQQNLLEAEQIWANRRSSDRFFMVKNEDDYPYTEIGIA